MTSSSDTISSLAAALPLMRTSLLPDNPNENMAVSLALAGLTFILTLIIGRPTVSLLRGLRMGKQIRVDGPQTHLVKTGTPTMGGVMIAISVIIVTAIFNVYGRLSMLLPILVLVAAGTLGAVDDLMTLVRGNTTWLHRRLGFIFHAGAFGMAGRFKFLWLAGFGLISAFVLYGPLGLHHMYVPFLGRYDIGLLYIPIATFAFIGTANAVNLTDGLDTLAGGTAAIAFCSYGIIAYVQGQVGVVTFCFTMVGALLGFLWFNAHPAQVFMGDVGSLAIGAALATAAFMTGQWLLLPVVGIVFIAETLSVMLQVGYFKLTKGKRLFKMSPLHNHFELSGWSETQIAMRLWIVSMMAGLLGVALALM